MKQTLIALTLLLASCGSSPSNQGTEQTGSVPPGYEEVEIQPIEIPEEIEPPAVEPETPPIEEEIIEYPPEYQGIEFQEFDTWAEFYEYNGHNKFIGYSQQFPDVCIVSMMPKEAYISDACYEEVLAHEIRHCDEGRFHGVATDDAYAWSCAGMYWSDEEMGFFW